MQNMSICAAIVRRSADSLLQSYYDKSSEHNQSMLCAAILQSEETEAEHNQSMFHVLFVISGGRERIYLNDNL